MGGGAVAAQVQVPPVGGVVQAGFGQAGLEDVEAFLALAAADDFADAGH